MLYFPGWGFNPDVLARYFPLGESDYDAVAWSLGIIRLQDFLRRTNIRLERALLIACRDRYPSDVLREFLFSYRKDPATARDSFYRKCLWGTGLRREDLAGELALTGDLDRDDVFLQELEYLGGEVVDLGSFKDRIREVDFVLTQEDLVVPIREQERLERSARQLGIPGRSYRVQVGHYPFPVLSSELKSLRH